MLLKERTLLNEDEIAAVRDDEQARMRADLLAFMEDLQRGDLGEQLQHALRQFDRQQAADVIATGSRALAQIYRQSALRSVISLEERLLRRLRYAQPERQRQLFLTEVDAHADALADDFRDEQITLLMDLAPDSRVREDFMLLIGLPLAFAARALSYRAALLGGDARLLAQLRESFDVYRDLRDVAEGGVPLAGLRAGDVVRRYVQQARNTRVGLVAETEAQTSANQGAAEAIERAAAMGGVALSAVRKQWVTMGDNRVRDTHAAIAGQTVRATEAFATPLGPMRYPGDPQGSLPNRMRCRCSVRYL